MIVHLDGDDPVRGNKLFAASDDPHDVWFKERAGSILGIDFNQPVPAVELALEYQGELT